MAYYDWLSKLSPELQLDWESNFHTSGGLVKKALRRIAVIRSHLLAIPQIASPFSY